MAEALSERDEWMRRAGPLYPGLVALWTLSAVPLPRGLAPSRDDLARSAPWFPLIGAAIGVGLFGISTALLTIDLVPGLVALLVVLCALAATAARLEHGMARTAQRMGRGAQAWAYGAVLAVVAIRVAALAGTRTSEWLAALVCAHLVARWAVLFLVTVGDRIDEPRAPGAPALPPAASSWAALGVSTVVSVIIVAMLGGAIGLIGVALAAAAAFAAGLHVQRRDGGLADSALAASACVVELVTLLVFAAAHPAVTLP